MNSSVHLRNYFPELLKFESTAEMEASELYAKIKPEVDQILNSIVLWEPPALAGSFIYRDAVSDAGHISALAWNIERGSRFSGIVDALKNHPQLKDRDLLFLTELDYGMARSGNRFVAKELGDALQMSFAFAPIYIALQKGSGVEEFVEGENTNAIHGLAMFSRYPMRNIHAIPLPNGKDKMWGKEKRLGRLRALVADVEHPAGTFRAVTVHLDALCSRAHRHRQMKIILDHLDTLPPLPVILGGDWNTTTFNSQNATRAILGYWRRVLMGVRNVVRNHYPHPDRYFEKRLFRELVGRGYEYKALNEIGAGTIHYDVASVEKKHEPSGLGAGMVLPIYLLGRKSSGRPRVVPAGLVCRKEYLSCSRHATADHRESSRCARCSALDHDAIISRFRTSSCSADYLNAR
jgi:endonuclease/exonuclease/phosphatase family metal-dependent hydrolase